MVQTADPVTLPVALKPSAPVDEYDRALADLVAVNGQLNAAALRAGYRSEAALAAALGISATDLKELRRSARPTAAVAARFRALRASLATRPLPATASLIDLVDSDGYDCALRLRWFGGNNAILKAHLRRPGTRWRPWSINAPGPLQWCWRFSNALLDDDDASGALFRDLRVGEGGATTDTYESFVAALDAARAKPKPALFTEGLRETIYPLEAGGVVIGGDYHSGVNAIVKEMRGVYLGPMRMWRLDASPAVLKNNLDTALKLQPSQVVVETVLYALVNGSLVAGTAVARLDVGVISSRPPAPEERAATEAQRQFYLAVAQPLAPFKYSKRALTKHLKRFDLWQEFQPDGIRHLVGHNSALLADDMGMGKSIQAVVAADFIVGKHGRTLIVCPASLLENWRREILKVLPNAVISKRRNRREARWVLTNYEHLDEMGPHAESFQVMITDEAHYLKEPTSQRTRLAFDIAAKIPHRYLLTGTPVLNREAEIYSLLRLSGHPIGSLPLADFLGQFAGNSEFRAVLNTRIAEWMLRRMKEHYLSLKGKRRQTFFLNPTPEQQASYDAAEGDAPAGGWMAKMHSLRRLLETIKLDYIAEQITDLRPADKTLVFFEYRESVAALRAMLEAKGVGVHVITSDVTTQKRQKLVDVFTDDPNFRVLIGTSAMSEGLNIQAANYVIHGGLPWTPTKMRQAEDRAYRLGQRRLVVVKIPLLENSIDDDLWEMLEQKRKLVGEVVESHVDERHEDENMRELTLRLRERAAKPRHLRRKALPRPRSTSESVASSPN